MEDDPSLDGKSEISDHKIDIPQHRCTMMNFSTRDYFFLGLSIALGVVNGYKLHDAAGDWIQTMSELCDGSINDSSSTTPLQPYLQWGIFDSFVCSLTQMFYEIAIQNPGGKMVLISTFTTYMPVLILMAYEAGRPTAKAFVKYPMIVALIAQFIGISLAFPLFWIPSYIASGGSSGGGNGGRGNLSMHRIYLSLLPPMVYMTFGLLVSFVPPTTFLWTFSAGILGGPIIVLTFLPLWLFSNDQNASQDNNNEKKKTNSQSAHSTLPYAACGFVCFFIWLWMVTLVILPQLGFSPIAIYQEVWGNAGPTVKFFTLDALVLWLSTILVIAYEKSSAAWEVIGATCLFGPGAAISLILAGLQVDDDDDLWNNTPTSTTSTTQPSTGTTDKTKVA